MPIPALPPDSDQVFLDHVGLFVPDLDSAPRHLESLGFRLTPFVAHRRHHDGEGHGEPSGTGNRCAMFEQGYLEVLGATADTPLAQQLHERLARYPGLHLIAFQVSDAAARHAALPERGLTPLPLVALSRPVFMGGGQSEARFSVVRMPSADFPEGRIQLVAHHTPELLWQPQLIDQPNGISALTGVLLCVADPAETAGRLARFIARPARDRGDYWELALDRGQLLIVPPAVFARLRPGVQPPEPPYIAEAAFRCRNLEATGEYLRQRQWLVEQPVEDRLYLPPDEALGMAIWLHEGEQPPWRF